MQTQSRPSRTRSTPGLLETGVNDHTKVMSSLNEAILRVFGQRSLQDIPLDPTAALRRSQKDKQRYQEMREQLPPWTDVGVLGAHCVAAIYSRAAYGHVARLGKFDSVASGGMVFSVEKIKFNMDDVDDASNRMAFLDMLALSDADIVCAQWKTNGPFCPVHVVARDHTMKWIVVAVRGTLSTKDILTDMAVNHIDFLEGTAHEGFVTAMKRLVSVLKDILQEELRAHPGYRLVLCGHSMGGAIAALGAAHLRKEAPWAADCVAYGIGTPAVLSRNIGERLARERAVFTCVNGRDWSPRSSTSNVVELMDDLCELGLMRSALRAATGGQVAAAKVEDARKEQLPPGSILQIVPLEGKSPLLLAAEPKTYRHAMSVWPDVEAHIPIFHIKELLPGFAEALRGAGAGPDGDLATWSIAGQVADRAPLEQAALEALRRLSLAGWGRQRQTSGLPPWPDAVRELVTAVSGEFYTSE
mmetsp:Transcript_116992/g.251526  ORF Transcript_116992/g.251526 Transcript_116992/m.251526 type:complete len:472 (-) Transcript_116992:123-1538(-)